MSRLLESIRCENGELQNLPFHQARMDASVKRLFSAENSIRLDRVAVPVGCRNGLYKCRIIYEKAIESIDFKPYGFPKIRSLQLVVDNDIEYSCKYTNRAALRRLLEKRGSADEILIVKNGLITDTSFTNVVFFDGEKWLTPAAPLLNGTQRERLLHEEKIIPVDIRPADLSLFRKARLINAMIRFEDGCDVTMGQPAGPPPAGPR